MQKKIEMKKLSKEEMKKIKGGRLALVNVVERVYYKNYDAGVKLKHVAAKFF
jgi:bacteriocin-like protein